MKKNILWQFKLFAVSILKCLFLSLLIFSGCSEKEEPLHINLDTDALVFESGGGSQTIAVLSNGEWTVSGETGWCMVSPKTGKGNVTVTVTVSENELTNERKATLTFRCGTETAKVEVTQAAAEVIGTYYVDVDWDKQLITGYNENTGVINIQYQGAAPSFKDNDAIVLPEEYRCEVRVIKSSTVSGNTVSLQTERGNICHLFMDTSFTLSTDPSLSSLKSSGGGKVITPSEIKIMTENGYQTIYRKAALKSDNDYGAEFDIFSFHEDYSGTDLYNSGNHRVFWEKCIFDIGLKGVCTFDFGRKIDEATKLPIGDLKKFEFYLDGNLNIDLLLKYVFAAQFKESKENLIKKNVIKMITVRFMVGSVPVVIFVDTHLYNRYEMDANAEITMSMGCNIQANAKMGLNFTKGAGISPIKDFTSSFTLYEPAFTAKGSLAAKGSIYPRIEFEIYGCLCPWIEPMPYLREDLDVGMRASTDGNSYLAWTSKSYAGLDCRMGIKTDFGLLIPFVDLWTSDIYNPIDYLLFDAPAKIELSSPANGTKLPANKPVDVCFYVSSYNNIPFMKGYYPCLGGLVNFDTQGDVNKWFAVSDLNGLVTVQWTPRNNNDRLTAKIVDKDGQILSEATFIPVIEKDDDDDPAGPWVLINGVRWATRNVGAPGTFVANPEDYGNYYQWNKGTTDFLLYNDYYNNANSTFWLPANDPSPAGYRVPTIEEIQSLTNATYVRYEWITQKGVNGGRFTDRASGNSIFLPAAGHRYYDDGTLYYVGDGGYYWSSTASDGDYAYYLGFNYGTAYWYWGVKSGGFSVRPVAEK